MSDDELPGTPGDPRLFHLSCVMHGVHSDDWPVSGQRLSAFVDWAQWSMRRLPEGLTPFLSVHLDDVGHEAWWFMTQHGFCTILVWDDQGFPP